MAAATPPIVSAAMLAPVASAGTAPAAAGCETDGTASAALALADNGHAVLGACAMA
jgi:hypothetical protein